MFHRLHDNIDNALPIATGLAAALGPLVPTIEGALIGAIFSLIVWAIKYAVEGKGKTRLDDVVKREELLEERFNEMQSTMNASFVFAKQRTDVAALHAEVNAERITQIEDALSANATPEIDQKGD